MNATGRLAGLVLACLVAACGGTAPASPQTYTPSPTFAAPSSPEGVTTPPPQATEPPAEITPLPGGEGLRGWLSVSLTQILFLQWTNSGGQLAGSLAWTNAEITAARATTETTNTGFSGVTDGASVTITFAGGLGSAGNWTGSFSDGLLTFSAPSATGSGLAVVTFYPASVADYNTAAATLDTEMTQQQAQIDASAAAAAAQAQRDREAAAAQAQRDSAVMAASDALGQAVGDLAANADNLRTHAADMATSVGDVRNSLGDLQLSYGDLKVETENRPMDDVEQGQVCVALGQVEVARGQVDVALGQFDIPSEPYKSALADRSGYVAAVKRAMTALDVAVGADPGGVSPEFTAADGSAALMSAATIAKAAAVQAETAIRDEAALVKSADASMTKARKLAATVAHC